jgi:putative flippase GtrA
MEWVKRKFQQLLIHKNDNVFVQFFRSVFVGGLATLVDLGVFYVLAIKFHLHPNLATTISFIFGLIVNYYLTQLWVFSYTPDSLAKSFSIFTIIGVVGLLLNNFLLYIMINYRILASALGMKDLDNIKITAKIIATFIVFIWNFGARKYFIFRELKFKATPESAPESEVNPR